MGESVKFREFFDGGIDEFWHSEKLDVGKSQKKTEKVNFGTSKENSGPRNNPKNVQKNAKNAQKSPKNTKNLLKIKKNA